MRKYLFIITAVLCSCYDAPDNVFVDGRGYYHRESLCPYRSSDATSCVPEEEIDDKFTPCRYCYPRDEFDELNYNPWEDAKYDVQEAKQDLEDIIYDMRDGNHIEDLEGQLEEAVENLNSALRLLGE